MLKLISLLSVASACFAHTITFSGTATEVGNGPQIPTNYFGITQVGQTFTAEIDFTDSAWDGQSALHFVVEYPATPVADQFDNGNGTVFFARVGPTVGQGVNWITVDFGSNGDLIDMDGGTDWSVWHWSSTAGGTFGQFGHQGPNIIVDEGILGPVFFDRVGSSLAPEPSTFTILLLGALLLAARIYSVR